MMFDRAFLHDQKTPLWQIVASLSPAVLLTVWFVLTSNTELTCFRHRVIGMAIIHGVDPTKRVGIFVTALALLVGVFLFLIFFFRVLDRILPPSERRLLRPEQQGLFLFSLFALASSLLGVLTLYPVYFYVAVVLQITAFSVLLLAVVKLRLYRAGGLSALARWLPNRPTLVLGWLSPAVFLFAYWMLRGGAFAFYPIHLATTVGGWLFAAFGYVLLVRALSGRGYARAVVDRALVKAGAFWVLIPVCAPVSNEWQFALARWMPLHPRTVALAGLALLLGLSLAAFLLSLRTPGKLRARSIVTNWYFPVLAATLSVYYFYMPMLSFEELDLLHLGNGLVPTHQFLQFGRIPFVHHLPARGLYDVLPSLAYSLMNGLRGLEGALWNRPVHYTITILLVYFVFAKMSNPLSAFLVVTVLPVLRLVDTYYIMVLLPALFYLRMIERPGPRRTIAFWCATVFASFWMPAVGKAVVLSGGLFLLFFYLRRGRKGFRGHLALFAGLSAAFVLAYLAGLLASGVSAVEVFSHLAAYARREAFASSYPSIIRDYTPLAPIVYGFFPVLQAFYLLRFLWLFGRREEKPLDYLFAFIAVASAVVSLRGLTRHCLVEGFPPYFALFLFMALPFSLRVAKNRRLSLSVLLALLCLFFLPSLHLGLYRAEGTARAASILIPKTIVKSGVWFTFRPWDRAEPRYAVSGTPYADLKNFFDRHMTADQTFFDFVNGHLLYVLTNRELPFMQHTALILQSDLPQQLYLKEWEKLNREKRVPFVVFRGVDSRWWGDALDGIPPPMAVYRLAEYIYRHYRPVTILDGLEIWGLQCDWPAVAADGVKEPWRGQHFELVKLPYIWAHYDEKEALARTAVLHEVTLSEGAVGPDHSLTIPLESNVDKTTGNYLHLRIMAPTAGTMRIGYGSRTPSSVAFTLLPADEPQDYLIRISCQWAWMNEEIRHITVESDVPARVDAVRVRKGD